MSPEHSALPPIPSVQAWTDAMREIMLEAVKVTVSDSIPGYFLLNNAAAETAIHPVTQDLILRLSQQIAAMPTERFQQTFQWPATWWQAVRQRWCPAWWLRRFPVRLRSEMIDVQLYGRLCPHLPIDPSHTHLSFMVQDLDPEQPISPSDSRRQRLEGLNPETLKRQYEAIFRDAQHGRYA